jgi:threonine dehydratase
VAACEGCYAVAVAYHGQQLGLPVTLFLPSSVSFGLTHLCRQYGSIVIVKGDNLRDTTKVARKFARLTRTPFLNVTSDPNIVVGNGTVGLDIVKQVPSVDAVILPGDDPALLEGTCCAAHAFIRKYRNYVKTKLPNCEPLTSSTFKMRPSLL